LACVHAGGVGAFVRSIPANLAHTNVSPFGGSPLGIGRFDWVSVLSRAIGRPLPLAAQAVVVVLVLGLGGVAYHLLVRERQPEFALAVGALTVLLTIHQNFNDFAAGFIVLAVVVARLRTVVLASSWRLRWPDGALCALAVMLVVIGYQPGAPHILWVIGLL